MANPNHVEILFRGKYGWNDWRRDNPGITPDLSGTDFNINTRPGELIGFREFDFSDTDLSHSKMYFVNLFDAKLTRAKLFKATLSYGNLCFADLRQADLRGAKLSAAWCERTNFTKSDLSSADLSSTILTFADLQDATMRDVDFNRTIIGFSNLSGVKGLESCRHYDRSFIDFHTLSMSGTLPLNFLQGCGLPESFIVQIPALVAAVQPIQFYSCFISYSSKDQKFAERLHADLQSKAVRCWFAPKDLKIGEKLRVGIDESIRVHDKLLLILSKNSIESEWVEKEVETAMERERQQKRTILFPIRLDDTVLSVESGWAADVRRSRNVGDFRRWKSHDAYSRVFERLLQDLQANT